MDNGFKDRVDKVFGSISSSSSSLWSVTDADIERREWKRSTRNDDQIPCCFNQHDDIDFDIRSSIGLDSTLDHEEEEDTYDKMAQGKENNDADDCLFMNDVTHHGPFLNSHNIVNNHPFSTHHQQKQQQQEDDDDDDDEPPCFAVRPPNDGVCRTKSILKRKNDEVSKPAKRVRFDPTCKKQEDESFKVAQISNNVFGVPDYVLNPSKYTRYNLDHLSHSKYADNSGASLEVKSCSESPVFIPRKKKGEVKQSSSQAAAPSIITIAAQQVEIQGDDVCTEAIKFQKPDRRYRSKNDNVC